MIVATRETRGPHSQKLHSVLEGRREIVSSRNESARLPPPPLNRRNPTQTNPKLSFRILQFISPKRAHLNHDCRAHAPRPRPQTLDPRPQTPDPRPHAPDPRPQTGFATPPSPPYALLLQTKLLTRVATNRPLKTKNLKMQKSANTSQNRAKPPYFLQDAFSSPPFRSRKGGQFGPTQDFISVNI